MALYDRLPNEPVKWYSRFLQYIKIPPDKRSISAVYNIEREIQGKPHASPTTNWLVVFRDYKWKERAEAWDMDRFEEEKSDIIEEVKRQKQIRLKMLEGFKGKLVTALAQFDPQGAKFNEINSAFKIWMELNKQEYDTMVKEEPEEDLDNIKALKEAAGKVRAKLAKQENEKTDQNPTE
jgi:hypothetical protein